MGTPAVEEAAPLASQIAAASSVATAPAPDNFSILGSAQELINAR